MAQLSLLNIYRHPHQQYMWPDLRYPAFTHATVRHTFHHYTIAVHITNISGKYRCWSRLLLLWLVSECPRVLG